MSILLVIRLCLFNCLHQSVWPQFLTSGSCFFNSLTKTSVHSFSHEGLFLQCPSPKTFVHSFNRICSFNSLTKKYSTVSVLWFCFFNFLHQMVWSTAFVIRFCFLQFPRQCFPSPKNCPQSYSSIFSFSSLTANFAHSFRPVVVSLNWFTKILVHSFSHQILFPSIPSSKNWSAV